MGYTTSIPEESLLQYGDNILYINWSNSLIIRSMLEVVKNRKKIRFMELLIEENNPVLKNENSNIYFNEFIVPFYKENHNYKTKFYSWK